MINSRKLYCAKNLIFRNLYINNETGNDNDTDTEFGYLEISVFQNETDEPIENALVRISKITVSGLYEEKAEGRIIVQYRTDANGNVPITKLPALNELDPNNNDLYIAAIHANGYYSAYVFNIQIYPNITASYKIKLSTISAGEDKFNFIIQPSRTQLIRGADS